MDQKEILQKIAKLTVLDTVSNDPVPEAEETRWELTTEPKAWGGAFWVRMNVPKAESRKLEREITQALGGLNPTANGQHTSSNPERYEGEFVWMGKHLPVEIQRRLK